MLKGIDHIIKNALENFVAPQVPDWDIFYTILLEEMGNPGGEEGWEDTIGEALGDLEYNNHPVAWTALESRLDELNYPVDEDFDLAIGDVLSTLPEATWGSGDWSVMSSRLDEMYGAWDSEFDHRVGEALVNRPDPAWNERHWQMLSSRLDELNDRPRLLMAKLMEAAAILLILIQLYNVYADFQYGNGKNNTFISYFDQLFSPDKGSAGYEMEDNTPGGVLPEATDQATIRDIESITTPAPGQNMDKSEPISENYNSDLVDLDKTTRRRPSPGSSITEPLASDIAILLRTDKRIDITHRNLSEVHNNLIWTGDPTDGKSVVIPQLTDDPHLIAYQEGPDRLIKPAFKLNVRDISMLRTRSADSLLSSLPTLQVIKPRIYSSMDVGLLADATNVEIQDYFAPRPYHVSTLNGGLYFRYKIQYKDMFGSLGGDYLKINYDGSSSDNVLTMVTLPLELGYNVVNLPSFRMYFSGGVAGRFVPLASYSTATFNRSSNYDAKSNKPANGLLNNGPFEINSYLSGRLSMGLDININKNTSISLHFSRDIWLKGRGIGYNLDKFRSNHIAIGTNFHF